MVFIDGFESRSNGCGTVVLARKGKQGGRIFLGETPCIGKRCRADLKTENPDGAATSLKALLHLDRNDAIIVVLRHCAVK